MRSPGLRPILLGLISLVMLAFAAPAQAAWLRVETDKFVVYGQGGERSLRDFATRLDTYDQVLRRFHPKTLDRKPATKVNVVLLNGTDELRRVRPNMRRHTQGVYIAMNEGVYAFVNKQQGLGSDDVLFHEYAHHFMLENFPAAYPAWFVEGFAEYFMTMDIKPKEIRVGGFNDARVYSIFAQQWVPIEELLSKTTAETRPERTNAYYAQAWLLTHYMRSDPKRAEQLNTAIQAIANGQEPLTAFQAATGMTSAELTTALKKYRRLQIIQLTGKMPDPPAMTVTTLPRSADDLLLDQMRLILAPTGQVDAEFLEGVRRKAARHPGDAFAERVLARAEFVMGNVAAGEAIMDRRLKSNPNDVEDLLLAGTGQVMAGLREPAARTQRFKAARPLLGKAYGLEKNDFRILYAYAFSRSIEPGYPTDNDLAVWLEARHLAPAVQEISLRTGLALLEKGRRDEAARALAPVINNPHGGRAAAQARALLNAGGKGVDLDAAREPEEEAEEPQPPGQPARPAA